MSSTSVRCGEDALFEGAADWDDNAAVAFVVAAGLLGGKLLFVKRFVQLHVRVEVAACWWPHSVAMLLSHSKSPAQEPRTRTEPPRSQSKVAPCLPLPCGQQAVPLLVRRMSRTKQLSPVKTSDPDVAGTECADTSSATVSMRRKQCVAPTALVGADAADCSLAAPRIRGVHLSRTHSLSCEERRSRR